jgi:hypothetical protein
MYAVTRLPAEIISRLKDALRVIETFAKADAERVSDPRAKASLNLIKLCAHEALMEAEEEPAAPPGSA